MGLVKSHAAGRAIGPDQKGQIGDHSVGETEAERDAGQAEAVVTAQLEGWLPVGEGIEVRLTVAYEPVWAIGTGRVPSVDDVSAMHRAIRAKLDAIYGDGAAVVRILYGVSRSVSAPSSVT